MTATAEKHCPTCRCGHPPKAKRSGGIRRTTADARFSTMIRERAGWRCEWPSCGKHYPPPTTVLQAAHMFSRRIAATRTDPDNAAALCYPHHVYADGHPLEKVQFFRERLGDEAFDALQSRAKAKRDRKVG